MRFIRAASEAPATPGAYALLLRLEAELSVACVRREALLPAGRYIYCGSARGPGGLSARLRRHMLRSKSLHWHVDRLTTAGAVVGAWIAPGGDECALNAELSHLPVPAPGFGSTDCRRCASHLRFWADGGGIAGDFARGVGGRRTPTLIGLQSRRLEAEGAARRKPFPPPANMLGRALKSKRLFMSNDTPKVEARAPRGLADRDAGELAASGKMLNAIREVYELYGFEALETPAIEYTDALGKFLPDQDRPNEGVFSFQDDDEQWLSLRYDLTAPLARYVAQNFDALPKPYRSYRAGYVFRNEKPGPGRFRQFMQFDADTVGSASPAADAEICMMAADTLERLGIKRGDYVLKINSRKVLDGVMKAVGLDGGANAGRRLTVLRAIDKMDRLGPDGVKLLLGAGRKDESGDFTKGAGLEAEAIDTIISFSLGGRYSEGQPKFDLFGLLGRSDIGAEGAEELMEIEDLARAAGYGPDRIRIDPSVVRGLEYYTGPVFEAELTFETKDEKGNPVRFGSVGGGGRYDGLVGRFRPESTPATGFSIGVSRLYAALKLVGSPIVGSSKKPGPVVVLVLDRDRLADYQAMVAELRGAGIAAELYLGAAGMKAQMKYADKRNSPIAIIQGSNERDKGEVQIKDLIEGARAAAGIATNEEWKAQRPAQISVPQDELVARVRDMLARDPHLA